MESTAQVVAPAAPAESAPANEAVNPEVISPTPAEGSEATAAPEAPQPPNPEKSRAQKRIDELTRQRYDEQRAREAAEARLAQIERQHALNKQFADLDAEAPQIEQFDSLHAYNVAMSNWTMKRTAAITAAQWEERMQEQAAKQAQFSEQAQQQQMRVQHENVMIETKMAAGVKKYPDFQAVIANPELPTVRGTPLFDIILAAEHAEDIAYHAAKKPGELERLLSMHPLQAAREIFRLDAKFAGAPTTSAPPPPPSRTGSATGPKSLDQMSDTEQIEAYRRRKRN